MQHGGPKQRVEVADVLADEMVQLSFAIGRKVRRHVESAPFAQRLETAEIADRGIEPDIKIFSGVAGNLEAEIGRIARDVPVLQARRKPLVEFGAHGLLQRAATYPLAEHLFEATQRKEKMFRLTPHRSGATDRRLRVDEIGRGVRRAAGLAAVAILVDRLAARAGATHITIGQEHAGFLVIRLTDASGRDVTGFLEASEHQVGEVPVLGGVRRVELIVADEKALIGGAVFLGNPCDELLGRDAFGLRFDHDRGAVGILGADVEAIMALHALEANPDVGLDRLDDVAQVQWAVSVGQGARDEDLP